MMTRRTAMMGTALGSAALIEAQTLTPPAVDQTIAANLQSTFLTLLSNYSNGTSTAADLLLAASGAGVEDSDPPSQGDRRLPRD